MLPTTETIKQIPVFNISVAIGQRRLEAGGSCTGWDICRIVIHLSDLCIVQGRGFIIESPKL
jgi:hypothetical protein